MNAGMIKGGVSILLPLLLVLLLMRIVPLGWELHSYLKVYFVPLIVGSILYLMSRDLIIKSIGFGLIMGALLSLTIVILLILYWPI